MATQLLLLLASLSLTSAIQLYSCSRNPVGNQMKILILDVNPDPVALPGVFTVGGTLEAMKDFNGNFSATVEIKKKTFIAEVSLPCVPSTLIPDFSLGSCHYDNLCHRLDQLVAFGRQNGSKAYCDSNTIPCSCPIPKGVYKMNPFTFDNAGATMNPLIATFLTNGDYSVLISAKNDDTGEEVMCYTGVVTLGSGKQHNQTAILEGPTRTDGIDLPIVG